MRAVIWTAYGPPEVLKLREIERPVPGDQEILVRVAVSNVFAGDCEMRRFDIKFPFGALVRLMCGIFKPRVNSILGQEYAGEVVETGKAVTRFKPGDRVYGAVEPLVKGSYAEYLVTKGGALITMPANLGYKEAAVATVGGLNALHCLNVAEMGADKPAQKILFNGAGGSIGTMAIQIAKAWGAHVTAVDASDKLQKLKEIGADEVIDYTSEDFTANGESYDVIVDVVGKSTFFRTLGSVKPGGFFILANPPFYHLLFRIWAGWFSNRRVRFALAGYKLSELERLRSLLASGKVKPVIDREYTLDKAVEAHHYVESGRRVGNVILNVNV